MRRSSRGLARGMALILAGEGEAGARSIRAAVAALEASDELRDDPHLVLWAAHGPLWLREAEAGRGLYERALEAVRSRAALGVLPEVLVHVARDWATSNEWTSAHAAYSEAITLARETGQDVQLAFGARRARALEARQGREADCRAHAAEAREACVRAGMGVQELWALTALGDLELGLGRPDAALAHYSECEELRTARGIEDADLSQVPELTETLLVSAAPTTRRRSRAVTSGARAGEGPTVGAGARGARPRIARARRRARTALRRGARPARADPRRLREPPGRGSPTAPVYAARAAASARANSCVRRSSCSTTSAPSRGRASRGSSSRRRARPRGSGIRPRSTSSRRRRFRSRCCWPAAARPVKPRRRCSSARRRSSTTCATSTGSSGSTRGPSSRRRWRAGAEGSARRMLCVPVPGDLGALVTDTSGFCFTCARKRSSAARGRACRRSGGAGRRSSSRDGGVERTSPGNRRNSSPSTMRVEERFADDRDHATPLSRFVPGTSAGGS